MKIINRDKINFILGDNMEFMKTKPDNYYDLAIVDPPYGIGINKQSQGKGGGVAKKIEYTKKDWDISIPPAEYFSELKRISKNQIIWGGNYFVENLKNSSCWIVWNKDNGNSDFADCEIAWTSFKSAVRMFKYTWAGMLQQNMKNKEVRIHPTQKPVDLYRWQLLKYAIKGMKILDTHGGSHTHAIAADLEGFELDIIEIDQEYFSDGLNAFDEYKRQLKLF